jgi:hypothetical protein
MEYCEDLRAIAGRLKTHFESGAFNRALPPLQRHVASSLHMRKTHFWISSICDALTWALLLRRSGAGLKRWHQR